MPTCKCLHNSSSMCKCLTFWLRTRAQILLAPCTKLTVASVLPQQDLTIAQLQPDMVTAMLDFVPATAAMGTRKHARC